MGWSMSCSEYVSRAFLLVTSAEACRCRANAEVSAVELAKPEHHDPTDGNSAEKTRNQGQSVDRESETEWQPEQSAGQQRAV